MKCMCAQTRPRFILSSERVFWGMEFEPMLTPREKSPLPENVPRGGSNPRRCGQRAQTLPTELFRPPDSKFDLQLLSQCGSTYDYVCEQVGPCDTLACCCDVKPTNNNNNNNNKSSTNNHDTYIHKHNLEYTGDAL